MENFQLFNFDNHNVRVLVKDGEPWFVGKDVAFILGYSRPSEAIRKHCCMDDTSKQRITDNLGREQETLIINESGLYTLILSSKLQTAKKFKYWVTKEVLPSIRKHGAYMTEQTIEKALTDPDFLIQLATRLKEEQEARKKLETRIEQDKPYTNFAKSIANSSDAITFGEFAKILNNNGIKIGRNRLFSWMRENGFLIKTGREKNKPMQTYVEQGLFQVKESVVHAVDQDIIRTTTLITGKGQLYFIDKLKQEYVKTKKDDVS